MAGLYQAKSDIRPSDPEDMLHHPGKQDADIEAEAGRRGEAFAVKLADEYKRVIKEFLENALQTAQQREVSDA